MKRRWKQVRIKRDWLSAKKCKIHLMVYREWKKKTSYIDAARKISKLLGRKRTIISTETKQLYQRFDGGETQSSLFEKDAPFYKSEPQFLNISRIESDGTSKHLLSSILFMRDDIIYSSDEILISNNGYFTISSCSPTRNLNQWSFVIRDLFNGTERTSSISFDTSRLNFKILGNYLLVTTKIGYNNLHTLHLLKINYHELEVEKIGTINVDFNSPSFLLDQLNDHKFLVYGYNGQREYMLGQIQNDKTVMGNAKNFDVSYLSNKRLVGNLLQYFTYDGNEGVSVKLVKFCELNLETMEKKEMVANIDLGDEEFTFKSYGPSHYCWSKNYFYGMFQTEKFYIDRLLAFDPQALKWSDVKIWASFPRKMFVDENEVMTVQVHANVSYPSALYRISLRKPEKLMNLTRLFAARESNLYKNDKYIKCVQKLPIQM